MKLLKKNFAFFETLFQLPLLIFLFLFTGGLPTKKVLEVTETSNAPVKDVVTVATNGPAELDSLLRKLRQADVLVVAAHLASDPVVRDAGIRAAVILNVTPKRVSDAAPLLAVQSIKHLLVCIRS